MLNCLLVDLGKCFADDGEQSLLRGTESSNYKQCSLDMIHMWAAHLEAFEQILAIIVAFAVLE